MTCKTTCLAITLLAIFAAPVFAAKEAEPGAVDSRIRSVAYSSADVVEIRGHYGFTTSVEFNRGETIETVSIGDSEAWQVVKPVQPNLLFVKPIEQNADTNMTVVTNQRLYNFVLFARQAHDHKSADLTFHIKFRYPNDKLAMIAYQSSESDRIAGLGINPTSVPPEEWNFNYGYSGDDRLRPTKTFDDGRFTYFTFSEVDVTPAIFLVDEAGHEQLVNFTTKGRYVVVERLARQFTLRDGATATCIFNQSFPTQQYDDGAPKQVLAHGRPARTIATARARAGPPRIPSNPGTLGR